MTDSNEERAVSPVIGVILMVAITVILAAVIGTFVLNLGSKVQTNVQAGASVSFDTTDNEITITYTSNRNADQLIYNTSGASHQNGNGSLYSVGGTIILGNNSVTAGGSDDDEASGDAKVNIETDFDEGDTVTVIVTAQKGDQSTVIVNRRDTI